MKICLHASSQDAEGQTLTYLSVSGHAIIKQTSITTNGALSRGSLSHSRVMKTQYGILSHYFYSWIQRTAHLKQNVAWSYLRHFISMPKHRGLLLASVYMQMCALVFESERWRRNVPQQERSRCELRGEQMMPQKEVWSLFGKCLCHTNPFYTHWMIHGQVYI